jgi:hypothetical protein
MKRAGMGFALIFSLVISSLFPTSVQADDNSNQYLRVKYTTITNPIIQTSAAQQEVTFTAFIETGGYQLVENDLTCNDGRSTISATPTEIAKNEFSASCKFNHDNSSQPGLRNIYLSTRYSSPGVASLKLIPANAKIIYPIDEKDSFGQNVVKNTYAFDLYSRQSVWLVAPVAINPPQSFKYPSFPKASDAYIVFDARNPKPVDFKVTINGRSKTFSSSCADQSAAGLTNETKIFTKQLIWAHWGPYSISTSKQVRTHSYLDPLLKGKKRDMSCSYLIGLKNPIFAGVQVAYVESAVRSVQFPKK